MQGESLSSIIAENIFDDIEEDEFELSTEAKMYSDMIEATITPDIASRPILLSRHAEDIFK